MDKEFLTVNEVAEKLNVDTETVYRWLLAGQLAGIKIGKLWRIPIAEYQKYISAKR